MLAVDPQTGEVRARVRVGRKPTQLALDEQRGRLYVSSFGAGTVTVIDRDRHAVLATIPTGRKPFGLAIDRARDRLYVTNAGQDTVTIIDTATNAVVGRRHVPGGPLGIGVDPAGRILVTSGTAGVLSFLDPDGPATSALVVGALPVGFGNFVGVVGVRCPEAAPCGASGPAVAGPEALVALLDAMADTLRQATGTSVADVAVSQAVVDGIAQSREDIVRRDAAALRRALRSIVRSVHRGIARSGIDRATAAQLLDLLRRARALAARGSL